MVSWFSLCSHFCLDGQEPLFSVHFSLDAQEKSGHAHHEDESASVHSDIDVKVSQWLSNKLPQIDLPIIVALIAVLFLFPGKQQSAQFVYAFSNTAWQIDFLPPLRAPPANSV
jgi:hypothetical protein